jgi:hypothetical protein
MGARYGERPLSNGTDQEYLSSFPRGTRESYSFIFLTFIWYLLTMGAKRVVAKNGPKF